MKAGGFEEGREGSSSHLFFANYWSRACHTEYFVKGFVRYSSWPQKSSIIQAQIMADNKTFEKGKHEDPAGTHSASLTPGA